MELLDPTHLQRRRPSHPFLHARISCNDHPGQGSQAQAQDRRGPQHRISLKEFGTIWMRPWIMLATEPIVLSLSLLSGFSDALIFTFLESFKPVYEQWGFGTLAIAWAFIPINLAYFIGYFSYYPWFWRDASHRKKNGRNSMNPERRLKWLLWTAPLEPIGTLTLQRQDFSDTLLT
jgi:hypothetical protein